MNYQEATQYMADSNAGKITWDDNGRSAASNILSGSGGGGGGGGSLAPFPDLKLSDIGGSAVDFAKTLNKSENDIFGDYLKKVQSQPKPMDIFTTLEENAGIPQLKTTQSTLQGQIYDLEDTLRRVEPDVSARSRNSVVTEAQRRGMVTAEQKPLIENLGWLGQSLGRVSSAITAAAADVTQRTGLVMEGLRQELEPYKEHLTLVSSQNSRMMTGFTEDRQAQLDILIQKINRGLQISDMEWQRANELADQEKQWSQQTQMLAMEYNKPNNQVIQSGGRNMLIDMNTGKVVADLGSTASASGSSISSVGTGYKPSSPKPTSSPSGSSTPPGINPQLYNLLYGVNQSVAPNQSTATNQSAYKYPSPSPTR